MSQRATASGRTSASPSPWMRGAGTSRHSSLFGVDAGELLHAGMLARTRQPGKRSIRIRACARRIRLRQPLHQPVAERRDARARARLSGRQTKW